jgi:CDP-diacylglycerol--serine O-phosphatidyltransferase
MITNRFKAFFPNLITLLNLFCGSIGIIYAIRGELVKSAFFVLAGIVFDFFDGFIARKLDSESDLGLQLDSLADMITSGLVPGIFMFNLLDMSVNSSWPFWYIIPYFGLLITLSSAYRLANFNISSQKNYFVGLPTPANTLLIISFPLILKFQGSEVWNSIILCPLFLVIITLLSSFLLNAQLKLLSLKFKTFDFKQNIEKYLFLFFSVLLVAFFKWAAIPLVVFFYIILSLVRPPNKT